MTREALMISSPSGQKMQVEELGDRLTADLNAHQKHPQPIAGLGSPEERKDSFDDEEDDKDEDLETMTKARKTC